MLLSTLQEDSTATQVYNDLFDEYMNFDVQTAKKSALECIEFFKSKKYTPGVSRGYSNLVYYYRQSGLIDSAFMTLEEQRKYVTKFNYKPGAVGINYNKSILFRQREDYDLAVEYGLEALETATEISDIKLMILCSTGLGNTYSSDNQLHQALKYYLKVDSIVSQNPDHRHTANNATNLYNIGRIYDDIGNFEKSIEEFSRAKDIFSSVNHQYGVAVSMSGIGRAQSAIGLYAEAEYNYLDAYDYFSSNQNRPSTIYVANELARLYFLTDRNEQAFPYLQKAIALCREIGERDYLAQSLSYMAQYYLNSKKADKAIEYAGKSEQLALELQDIDRLSGALEIMYRAYKEKGDFENAYHRLIHHKKLADSLREIKAARTVEELEARYNATKKEQEIVLLQAQKELSERRAKNQRNNYITGISILGLLLIALFILYKNKQKTHNRLRQLEAMKSRFFANITHEFRTPLTLISGPILRQLSKENLTSAEKNDLGLVKRNSDRLLELINQLLELSKIEGGSRALAVSEGNLSLLIENLIEVFSYQAQEKNILMEQQVSSMEAVWFDRDVIEKIISNLMSNAVKYCPDGGLVSLVARKTGGGVEFLISNTSETTSEEDLESIFTRFHQGNIYSDGVGIGLSLVKELVFLCRGSIKASRTGKGLIQFKVILPIEKSAYKAMELKHSAEGSIYQAPEPAGSLPLSTNGESGPEDTNDAAILLLVDDNKEVRYFVKSLLQEQYQIIEAENGKVGIDKAIAHIPDIIISDIMMPVTDGTVLCETLKKDQRTCHIPVILLTAKAGEEHEIKGLQTGADAYLTKPFSSDKLKAVMTQLLETRALLRKHFSQEVILQPSEIEVSSYEQIFLDRLQNVLDEELTNSEFNAERFSVAIGMSRMQLHRKLKALTGFSTSEFIKEQRLKLASKLLKKSNINISDIGYLVGFNQHAYFSTCFKESFGVSPTEYVKQQFDKNE